MEPIQNIQASIETNSLLRLGAPRAKTLKEQQKERKQECTAALHKTLMDAIAATCTTLLKTHAERCRIQNELFLERMRSL
ncbi:MAG: hypothetical protein FJZ58_06725 [Chlamydiae bacterium]|nr:hypothetical protein [Chlamydiota bacterium]